MKINKPTLLIDKERCLSNISAMKERASCHQLKFRPHFKTHQSQEVGSWFKDFDVDAITVSSVSMAKCFADDWKDITIAFPFNIHEMGDVLVLQEKAKINLLLESVETVQFLNKHLQESSDIYIKADTGYGRTGIEVGDVDAMDEIIEAIEVSDQLNFTGFISHAGHSYQARSKEEILVVHEQNLHGLDNLRKRYQSPYPELIISTGDTPTCSVAENWQGVDEIRPGNFVYYDLMQEQIGSCNMEDIAVAVACPVVAKHENRNEVVVYGGAVHLSKDFIFNEEGNRCFGLPVNISDGGWSTPIHGGIVKSLSQEHGIIHLDEPALSEIQVGDILGILPVHSCLTTNLLRDYAVI